MKKHTETIVIRSSADQSDGFMVFRKSGWDTEHFGLNTVIIDCFVLNQNDYLKKEKTFKSIYEDFMAWCLKEKIKFVVARISSLDLFTINELIHKGFDFIESWAFNKYDLRKHTSNPLSLKLRRAKESDLEYMLEYSKHAFNTQHFHADRHIPYEKAEGVYKKWIITAANDPNQRILVYDHEEIPSAFMIYYSNDLSKYYNLKFAQWKMALLNPKVRGIGIGTSFFSSLFDYHKNEGFDFVDSGLSLRNIVSLNLHNKVNFKIVSIQVSLHLWIDDRN